MPIIAWLFRFEAEVNSGYRFKLTAVVEAVANVTYVFLQCCEVETQLPSHRNSFHKHLQVDREKPVLSFTCKPTSSTNGQNFLLSNKAIV